MSEIKVRLSLLVPGATMLSSQECEEKPKESYTQETIKLVYWTKKGKKKVEDITINLRKNRPAKQVICISKEAYDFMVNSSEIPNPKYAKKIKVARKTKGKGVKTEIMTVWANFTDKQRLEYHLADIAEAMNANGFSYEILED